MAKNEFSGNHVSQTEKSSRVLIITRHRLHENNGGANATKGFIHCFATIFEDCSLICPAFHGDSTTYIPANVTLYPYEDCRSKIQKGLDVYRGRICANELFVKKHLKEYHYDVVVIDHSFAGASLVKVISATGAKIITIHHNVESDYLRDNRKEYSLLYRFPYIHFAMKAEQECLQNSDINLTLTARDAQRFREDNAAIDLHVYRWGVFEYRPIADVSFEPKAKGLNFIITGSLCFVQSLTPIMHFLKRYWPILKKECPGAHLVIAGRNPSEELLQECSGDQSVEIVPNPDDMAAVVRQADFYICPINAGSGLKLRVLDGLKQGIPVLCHEISAAGYEDLVPKHCLFPYHDENTFLKSLRTMLAVKVTPDVVYRNFKENFSIEKGVERLYSILEKEHIV